MRYEPAVVFLLVVAMISAVTGCSGSPEESGSAVEGLAEQAEGLAETAGEMVGDIEEMTGEELQAKVDEIRALIAEKEAEAGRIAEKIEGLSPSDLAGEEATNLKGESETLKQEIEDLKKKLEAYVEKLGG
jgi:chromosome segregation ATPase